MDVKKEEVNLDFQVTEAPVRIHAARNNAKHCLGKALCTSLADNHCVSGKGNMVRLVLSSSSAR